MNLRRLLLLLLIFGHAPEVSGQETRGQIPVASLAAALDPETKCLALSVYWEGKSETRKGQLAVAHTVLNRVRHPSFPDTICGVVSQQSDAGRRSCQFSWWCDGKRDEPHDDDDWLEAVSSARDAMTAGAKDPTQGALYFHSARIKTPKWAKSRKRLARIGDHIFYR